MSAPARVAAALLVALLVCGIPSTGAAATPEPTPVEKKAHAPAPKASPSAGARAPSGAKPQPAANKAPASKAKRTADGAPARNAGAAAESADACPAPDVIIEKLQARYDATKAFRADFRQETTVAAVAQSEEARGKVAFKKPGKMRWDYSTPEEQVIVSDGTMLWIYQPTERQVLKAPFRAAFVSTTPISFLTGVGKIADDFTAAPDARGCAGDRIYVQLIPKSTPDVGSLGLGATRATYDIVEARVTDPVGNTTTLTFSNVERNVDIPDREFHFELPPGVDVIPAPGSDTQQ